MAAAEYLWGLIEPAGVPLIISTHHNAECSEYSAVKDYRDGSKVFGGGGVHCVGAHPIRRMAGTVNFST